MNTALHFDFVVDETTNSIRVEREFDAPRDVVWKAWTTAELLDQWWAPRPYKTVTKSMDFRSGGMWLYYMLSPEGQQHWCKLEYHVVDPQETFSGLDAFCDEDGVINMDFPRASWKNTFIDQGERTLVTIVASYDSLDDLQTIISMGMREGFTMALSNLDELVASMK